MKKYSKVFGKTSKRNRVCDSSNATTPTRR
jgi:hypothetical protein